MQGVAFIKGIEASIKSAHGSRFMHRELQVRGHSAADCAASSK